MQPSSHKLIAGCSFKSVLNKVLRTYTQYTYKFPYTVIHYAYA